MLSTIIFLSCMSVAGTLFALLRVMHWRAIIKRAVAIDVLFTIAMVIAGSGTVQGMAVAVTAAVIMSVVLWVGKLALRGSQASKPRLERAFRWVKGA